MNEEHVRVFVCLRVYSPKLLLDRVFVCLRVHSTKLLLDRLLVPKETAWIVSGLVFYTLRTLPDVNE